MDADMALAFRLQEEEYAGKLSSFDASNETNSKKSLIDPLLEYTDPTPDIYNMFVNFDQRFFWSSLGSVEVKWSPRMTSCAGICQYRSHNGATTVSLSLPLLKLRPRKDLVETLLHEMIHAYLFVTKNFRDRDGHGPEFQSHMRRINKIAGTNITIYHTFHAEVDVYKTHWWRCNGPCQYQKPFYGMVKRAMNRAPGPNDFWYAAHQSSCGGSFVKVKEPENFRNKKGSSKSPTKGNLANSPSKGKTLTNYFKIVNTNPAAVGPRIHGLTTHTVTKSGASVIKGGTSTFTKGDSSTVTKPVSSTKTKTGSHTTTTSTGKRTGASVTKGSTSTFTKGGSFTVTKPVPSTKTKTGSRATTNGKTSTATKSDAVATNADVGASTMTKSNTSARGVTTFSDLIDREDSKDTCGTSSSGQNIVPFSGKGYTLGKTTAPVTDKPWLKRFHTNISNNSSTSKNPGPSKKSPSSTITSINDSKKVKVDDSSGKPVHKENTAVCSVACPVCNNSVRESEINQHLDMCLSNIALEEDMTNDDRCVACNEPLGRRCNVPTLCKICEQDACSILDGDIDNSDAQNEDCSINCPMCEKKMKGGDLERHLEICIGNVAEGNEVLICDDEDDDILVLD